MIWMQRWWLSGSGSGQVSDEQARGSKRGDAGKGRNDNNERMQVLKHDGNEVPMQCKWCDDEMQQTNKSHDELEKHGRRQERRSRGVTTLHHYKRISSRDLGWHRGKTEDEEVKQSCFFDKRVKPKNLARLNKFKEGIQQRWTKLKTLRLKQDR